MPKIRLSGLKGLNRNYFLLVLGDFVSKLGSSIFGWAVSWYVLELTGSTIALGFSLMLTTLPPIIISIIGGAFVDKYAKKIFIVGADIIRGILFFLLAYLFWSGQAQLSLIYLFVFVEAVFRAIFRPAVFAALPLIVKDEKIYQAKAFNQSVTSFSMLIAPLLSAILLDRFGILLISFLNAISFCLSAISELFIQIKEDPKQLELKVHLRDDLRDSFQALREIKVLFSIVLMLGVTNLVTSPLSIMLPITLIKETLGLGETAWGLFRTCYIIGTFVGSVFLTFFRTRWTTYQIIFFGMVILGLVYMSFGLTVNYLLLLTFSWANGLLNSLINISLSTLTTVMTPKNYLGKFSGLTSAISTVSYPFSYLIASLITEQIGVQSVYFIYGAFYTCVVLWVMGNKSMRREAKKTVSV